MILKCDLYCSSFVALFFFVNFVVFVDMSSYSRSFNKSDDFYHGIGEKPYFVMFYTSWCGHCQRLKPTFEKLAEKYNHELKEGRVILGKVDCDRMKDLCFHLDITRYPTLLFFWSDARMSFKYKGKKTQIKLLLFIEEMLKLERPPLSVSSSIRMSPIHAGDLFELTSQSFKETIRQSQFSFIKFFVPWCSHCQAMSAVWKHLRNDFLGSEKINIAQIDCTKHPSTCWEQRISGYPSLLMFKSGEMVAQYYGERDYDMMKEFISSVSVTKNEESRTENNANGDKKGEDGQEEDGKHIQKCESTNESDGKSESSDIIQQSSSSAIDEAIQSEFNNMLPENDSIGNEFDLDPSNFKVEISKKIHVTFFYGTGRKEATEDWLTLRKTFVHLSNLTISQINCEVHGSLCREENVVAYPTIRIYHRGNKMFDNVREKELKDLKKFIIQLDAAITEDTFSVNYTPEDIWASSLVHLDEDSFHSLKQWCLILYYNTQLENANHVISTWKNLAEQWTGKSADFKLLAADQEKHLSFQKIYKIEELPSIHLFHQFEKVKKYTGEISVKALNDFIREVLKEFLSLDDKEDSIDEKFVFKNIATPENKDEL